MCVLFENHLYSWANLHYYEDFCTKTSPFYSKITGHRISIRNPSQSLTLLDYIRNDLGLTGTKLSCGESGCGTCTVTCTFPDFYPITSGSCQDAQITRSVNGKNELIKNNKTCHYAINACTTKLITLHGMSITTIEGLGSVSKVNQRYLAIFLFATEKNLFTIILMIKNHYVN